MRRRLGVAGLLSVVITVSLIAQSDPTPRIPDVLLSRQLLESERLAIGDTVTLAGNSSGDGARQFRIAGVHEPVPDPMRLGAVRHEVRLHLPDLLALTADSQDPLDLDSVDVINVSAPDKTALPALRQALTTRIPSVVVTTSGGGEAKPFVVLERFHYAIAIVTVIASSFFLLALMLMLVDERRATLGILRLIGVRRRRIVWHVLAEGVVIALAGAAFGIVLAAALQSGVNQFFQWRYDTALIFVHITPAIALRSVALSVPLGVLATLASSWSILRRDGLAPARR